MGKDTAEVIRQTLGVQVPDLLCWTERLREWLSVAVLQSFLGLVDTQHTRVNKMLQDLGQSSSSLPSLADAVNQRGADIAGALESSEQLINRIKSSNDERLMPLFLVSLPTTHHCTMQAGLHAARDTWKRSQVWIAARQTRANLLNMLTSTPRQS
jgi:hypothetical protein